MRTTLFPSQIARTWALAFGAAAAVACGDSSTAPVAVASVEVTPATSTRLVGETIQLAATAKDAGGTVLTGRGVTWTTSAATVATVSASGLVTGVADGTATITATVDGKSGTAAITVVDRCSTTLSVPIALGQTRNGTLAAGDCQLSDQSYADAYVMTVSAVTNVQIDLVSTAFDAYLFLFEETATDLIELAHDDDSGGGNNARIVQTLNPGRTYHIVVNSFDRGETGAYSLSVTQAAASATSTAMRAVGPGRPGKLPAVKFSLGRLDPRRFR